MNTQKLFKHKQTHQNWPKCINTIQKVNKLIKVAWVCASTVRWPTTVAGPKA